MTIEAMQAFGWKSAGIALRLRNHPAQVQTLKPTPGKGGLSIVEAWETPWDHGKVADLVWCFVSVAGAYSSSPFNNRWPRPLRQLTLGKICPKVSSASRRSYQSRQHFTPTRLGRNRPPRHLS
jgi:hypothetical protein